MKNCRTFLLIAGFLLVGCAPSRQAMEEPSKQEKKELKSPLADYEATLNPSDFDEEVEEVQKVHTEEKQSQQLEIPRDSTVVHEDILQGFRIQIFSSSNIDDANNMRILALEKFQADSVYIVYDPPVYKVRVGDFVNRYEANQHLPEFIDKGYPDAWVVPDRVVQRNLIAVPKAAKKAE